VCSLKQQFSGPFPRHRWAESSKPLESTMTQPMARSIRRRPNKRSSSSIFSATKIHYQSVKPRFDQLLAGYDAQVAFVCRTAVQIVTLTVVGLCARQQFPSGRTTSALVNDVAAAPGGPMNGNGDVPRPQPAPEPPQLEHRHRFGVPPTEVSVERWRRADNFTPAGRRVVAEAHLQAYAHRSDHVGTEHLLLALVAAGHQEVDDILDRLGLSADDL